MIAINFSAQGNTQSIFRCIHSSLSANEWYETMTEMGLPVDIYNNLDMESIIFRVLQV